MVSSLHHLTQADLLRRLQSSSSLAGLFSIPFHGLEIPLSIHQHPSPVLIVTFSGASNRERRPYPQFDAPNLHRHVPASVIGIADPSLAVLTDLSTAWYSGHTGYETQKLLPDLIHTLAHACNAERLIFFGGSAGGFAALYYSWTIPGSVCLVFNPQTRLDAFPDVKRYRTRAWPDLPAARPLSDVIVSDLTTCYAERVDNTVIYLQAAPDHRHVTIHFAPFLAAITAPNHARFIARLSYWGLDGHRSVPSHAWLPWLTAAVTAPTTNAPDIQHARGEHGTPPPTPAPPLHDIHLADHLIARLLLETEAEGTDCVGPTSTSVNNDRSPS